MGSPAQRVSDHVVAYVAVGGLASCLMQSSHARCTVRSMRYSLVAQMVLETKAGLEAGVVGAGHRFAAKRLDAQRSTAGWVGEQMGGLAYLGHIRELAKRVDADWAGVQARPWETRMPYKASCA